MNAVNPVQSSVAPGDHPPATEPSMEEILASIRRIIADDQSFPGRSAADLTATTPQEIGPGSPAPDTAPTSTEPVTGDEAMHVLRTPNPDRASPHETAHSGGIDPSIGGAQAHDVDTPQFPSPEGHGPELPLVPPEIPGAGSVTEDLEAALAAAMSPEPDPLETPAALPPGSASGAASGNLFSPSIDSSVTTAFNTLAASRLVASSDELRGLVREMIRPLLKAWVDEHLPNVVERLVTAEIERIARGGT